MKIGTLDFTPSLFMTLVTMIAVAIFSTLAVWQLQRAYYKQSITDKIAQQNQQAPLVINKTNINQINIEQQQFRHVQLSGEFTATGEILLDNIVQQGKVGYFVFTPFQLSNSQQHVLINRGWVTVGNDRNQLPNMAVPQGQQHLTAVLKRPRSKPAFIGDTPADIEDNNRWLYLDIELLNRKQGLSLPLYTLQQTTDTGDGLKRNWDKYKNKAGMHIGYMIQWGAFALIVLIAFISLNLKRRKIT